MSNDNNEALIYKDTVEQIASGDCTGSNPSFVCKIAGLPRSQWCPKCIAEDAVTRAQKIAKETQQ